MTPAQERRLLFAALGYARADAECRRVIREHSTGKDPDAEGAARKAASREKRKWKLRLLRAAGEGRKQPLLPLEEAASRRPA